MLVVTSATNHHCITPAQAKALKVMADVMRQESCLPSDQILSARAGVSRSTFTFHRVNLEAAGLIIRRGAKRVLRPDLIIDPEIAIMAIFAWSKCKCAQWSGKPHFQLKEALEKKFPENKRSAESVVRFLVKSGYLASRIDEVNELAYLMGTVRLTYEARYLWLLASRA